MRQRVNVVAIIHNNKHEILLCKQTDKGVYPNQWAIPGGGVELSESLEAALRREVKEETNLEITNIKPFIFSDDIREKKQSSGETEIFHMIYLLFDCEVVDPLVIKINHEWDTFSWVNIDDLKTYDLNSATVKTFTQKGWL